MDTPIRTLIFTKQSMKLAGDPCQNHNCKRHAKYSEGQPHFVLRQHLTSQSQNINHDLPPNGTRFLRLTCIIWCRCVILKE